MILCVSCGTVPVGKDFYPHVPDCECGVLWVTRSHVLFGTTDEYQVFLDQDGEACLRYSRNPVPEERLREEFGNVLVHEVLRQ